MSGTVVTELVNLFVAGLLAGEELVVRVGVRGPLAGLEDRPHIEMRQALILRLRVVVPTIFLATLATGVAVVILVGGQVGAVARYAALLALVVWLVVTAFGTVPINAAALEWDPDAPPADWKLLIDRWERLNSVRALAAAAAFALFLIAFGHV